MDLSAGSIGIPLVAALVAAIVVFVAIALLLRARQRREVLEASAGLKLLHGYKWRELAQLLLQALRQRGYEPAETERMPGEGGFDLLVQRGSERYLVQCKHGGAFHVGGAAVRDLFALMPTHDASGAILVTTGRFDAEAQKAAKNRPVQLLDGVPLWREVKPFLPAETLAEVERAVAASGRRFTAIKVIGGLLAGAVAYAIATWQQHPVAPAAPTSAAKPAAPRQAASATANNAAASSPAATVPSPATPAASTVPGVVPELTEAQQQERRAAALAAVRAIAGVESSDWLTKSTLAVAMQAGSEERRAGLVAAVCGAVLVYEELRYTRLQVTDSLAVSEADKRVHWRQCQ